MRSKSPDSQGEALSKKIARTCAGITVAFGVAGLASHLLGIPFLRGFSQVNLQMKPNTGLGLIAIGTALFLFINPKRPWQIKLGRGFSLFAIILGALTFAETFFDVDFGIDQLISREELTPDNLHPGRMVPATALNFVLKGIALWILDWETVRGRRPAQILSLITALVPIQILIAYSHGKEAILSVGQYPYLTQMAPQTALAWIALSLGTLCARPNAGFMRPIFANTPSATTLRRVLCLAIVLPPLLAWVTTLAGTWDLYHPGFGASMLTLIMIGLFVTFIWKSNDSILAYENVLHDQAEKLQDSNEALRRFAAVASHDLKSPLQTMILNVDLLARRPGLDEQSKQNLKAVGNSAQNMNGLIDKLLEYTISRESLVDLQTVDLNEVVQTVVENLQTQISEVRPTIDVPNLPSIQGDDMRLTQLFQNLIANALKYRTSDQCVIRINWFDRGDNWLFSISDNGIGFEPKDASLIFEPFMRSANVARKPGAGIGLATCKEIVNQHKGRIWAESKVNEGSTFYFTISKFKKAEKSQGGLLEFVKKI